MSHVAAVLVELDGTAWSRALPEAEAICTDAVCAALETMGITGGEVSVLLTDDATIRTLNERHRGKDKATDVLSFPQYDAASEIARSAAAGAGPPLLGDVVVAYETAARDAEASSAPLAAHLAHLVVHGVMHLTGLDHRTDDDAEAMEALEARALARLGVADPYAAPAKPAAAE